MKIKMFFLTLMCLIGLSSCQYDDSGLKKDIDALDGRVSELEGIVQNINSSIKDLQTVVKALESGDRIVSVTPVEGGFEIKFSKSGEHVIKSGDDGVTPVITAKLNETDNVWYWAVNGDFLEPKLPVTSHITPKVRINGDNFEISYDSEATWEIIGPAGSLPQGAIVIDSVQDNTDEVVFELSNGQTITIPKEQEFALLIDNVEIATTPGAMATVKYTISGADAGTVVDGFALGGLKIQSIQTDIPGNMSSGTIIIQVPDPIPADGKVFIFAVNSKGVTSSRRLTFEEGIFLVDAPADEIPADGGMIPVMVMTNYDYDVNLSEEEEKWISYELTPETKAIRNEIIMFMIAPNAGDARSAIINFGKGAKVYQSFTINQAGA